MGVCLCKDRIEDNCPDSYPDDILDQYTNANTIYNRNQSCNRNDRHCPLSETVDRLVKETLEVIGTIVDK